MLSYLWEPNPSLNKMVAIAYNAKAFDLHFILKRATILKWQPELIMNGMKITCMKMEHLIFWIACLTSLVRYVSYTRRSV